MRFYRNWFSREQLWSIYDSIVIIEFLQLIQKISSREERSVRVKLPTRPCSYTDLHCLCPAPCSLGLSMTLFFSLNQQAEKEHNQRLKTRGIQQVSVRTRRRYAIQMSQSREEKCSWTAVLYFVAVLSAEVFCYRKKVLHSVAIQFIFLNESFRQCENTNLIL